MSGYNNQNKQWRGGNDRTYYQRNRNPQNYPSGRPPWPDQMNPPWVQQSRPPNNYYQHGPARPSYHRNQRQYANYNSNFNWNDAMLPPPVPPQEDFTVFTHPDLQNKNDHKEPEPTKPKETPQIEEPVLTSPEPEPVPEEEPAIDSEPNDPVSVPVVGSKKQDKLPDRLDRTAIMKLVNSTTRYEPAMQKLLREQRSQLTQNLRNKYNEKNLPNSTSGEDAEVIPNFTVDFIEELQFLTAAFENEEVEEPIKEETNEVKAEEVELPKEGEEGEDVTQNNYNLGSIDLPSNLEVLEFASDDSFFNFSEINKDVTPSVLNETTIETTTLSPIKPKETPKLTTKTASKGKKGKKKKKKGNKVVEQKSETPTLKHSLDKFRLTLRSEILKSRTGSFPSPTKHKKHHPEKSKKETDRPSKIIHKKHLNNRENVDKILSELEAQASQTQVEEVVIIPDEPEVRCESPIPEIEHPVLPIENRKWRSPGEKKYMSTITPVEQSESTKEILLKLYKIDLAIQQLMEEKMQLYSKLNVNNNYGQIDPEIPETYYVMPEKQKSPERKRKDTPELDRPIKRSKRLSNSSENLDKQIKPCVVSLVSIDVEKYSESVGKSKIFCKDHTGSILFIKVFKNSIVLAAGEDGNIYKYDITTGNLLGVGRGHKEAVTSLIIVNKSKHHTQPVIYSGSLDATFKSFDLETMNPCGESEQIECAIQSMGFDWGFIFIGTKSGYIHKYSLEQNALEEDRRQFSNQSILVIKTCREGGRRVLVIAPRNEPVSVRDAMTGLLLRYVSSTTLKPTIFSILLQDSVVYCGTSQKAIIGYDFTNGESVSELSAGRGVVCLTGHNKLVYAGCYDGHVYVFDPKTKQKVITLPGLGHMVLSLDVTDTKIVIGCKNSNLVIMDVPDEIKNFKPSR